MKLWKTKKSISCMPNQTVTLRNEESNINSQLAPFVSADRAMSPAQSEDSGLAAERGTTYATITLPRDNTNNMGVILAERSDLSYPPIIASLSPLGNAADFLAPGDRLHQIDGVSTIGLTNSQIMHMLCGARSVKNCPALIEIEYSLPEYMSQNNLCVTSKLTQITVERESGCLGLTLRGGGDYPLIVTHVRPYGPVHKTGRIKPGDRLLRVDNISLVGKTLVEAQQIIKCGGHITDYANLIIEYDVSVVQNVEFSMGPLLIEIERLMNDKLGLVLCNYTHTHEMLEHVKVDETAEHGIYIASILPASIADRCGALSVGDQILAIDDINIENSTYTPDDVMTLLDTTSGSGFTQMQIMPAHALSHREHLGSPKYGLNTLESRKSRQRQRLLRKSSVPLENGDNSETVLETTETIKVGDRNGSAPSSSTSGSNFPTTTNISGVVSGIFQPKTAGMGICRTETFPVLLDCSMGSGLVLGAKTSCGRGITIWDIIPESFADRCGCIQKGDRIVAINKMYNLDAATMMQLLGDATQHPSHGPSNWLEVDIEFDMPDTVIPSSGIFNVKVIKNGKVGLGLNLNTSSHEGCVITEVKPGSPSHRTGSLRIGDILLAIDNHPVQHFNVDSLLKDGLGIGDVTTLTVKRVVLPDFLFDAQQKLPNAVHTNFPNGSANDTDLYSSVGSKYADITYNDCISLNLPALQSECRRSPGSNDENTQSLVQMRLHLDVNNWSNSNDRSFNQTNKQTLITEDESHYHEFRSSYESDQRYSNMDCTNLPPPMDDKVYGSVTSSTSKNSSNNLLQLVLSVRLEPNGGLLGITLAGSEDINKPIIISSLLEGGTADKSGQIQVGDELLSINGESLKGLSISRATNILQNLTDVVDLKILRFLENQNRPNDNSEIRNLEQPQDLYAKVQRPHRNPCNTNSLNSLTLRKQKLFSVSLFKDKIYDDYGFSVSDGLYERGVFINRIRTGGPADKSGLLRSFDRIMQVNDTKTQDFDCCLTVPLIASAGDKIELMIQRSE